MRTKLFFYNSFSTALQQIIILIIGLILPRMYIITYGSSINGLVSSLQQLIDVFAYVEAGLGATLIYSLFRPLAEDNKIVINGIVSQGRIEYIKTSGIYMLLVFALSAVYPFIIDSAGIGFKTVFSLVIVIGLFGALEFLTLAKYKVLLAADQKLYVLSLVSTLSTIINFIIIYVLILSKTNIVIVRLIPLVSFLVRYIILDRYVKKHYPYINYRERAHKASLDRRFDALIMQLAVSLNLSIPIIIVSVFCSLKEASVFSIYNMVFVGLLGIVSVFTTGVSSAFGNIWANDDENNLQKTNSEFEYILFMMCACIYSCALILIIPFVKVYTHGVTDINYVNPTYGLLFVIWSILHNARIPYNALITATGLYEKTRNVNIVQVVLLVILSLILVHYLQITGVLIALIIAALYRSIDLIILVKKIILRASPIQTFVRIARIFVIIFISYLPFLLWVKIDAVSLTGWFIWALGTGIWCLFVTCTINYISDKSAFKSSIERITLLLPKRTAQSEA